MVVHLAAAGFVLTGGASRRLGRDKALVELGGKPLAVRTAEVVRSVAATVTLVGAPERYAHLGLPTLSDAEAGRGPLAGVVAALRASKHDWNLMVACDLPYLEPRLLEFLLEQATAAEKTDAVVPRVGGYWQVLCAAYHRRCLAAFERALAGGQGRITDAFDRLRVRAVEEEELERFAFEARIFKNMNTAEEYEEAKRVLSG